MMRVSGPFVALSLAIASSAPVLANDVVRRCNPAGDRYAIEQEVLFHKSDPNRREIPYETLQETVLTEKRGYCLAKGSRYEFQARTYRQRIRFTDDGNTVELLVLCEMAWDELPASLTCEKEVVTHETKAPENRADTSGVAGGRHWTHNGSVMRLEADGPNRRFVYAIPRPDLLAFGAKPGDTVFEGRREGRRYRGTAYIYTETCGRVGYPVAGNVASDQRSVTMEGRVPVHGSDCRTTEYRRERLVFELVDR
jgi:hypothetical protein